MKEINVGITSGYFNPFHKGHLSLIKEAKSKCDFLIVIVNNDKQQILKKGKIIMNEDERIDIIESVHFVDLTVLSIDEDAGISKSLEYVIKNTSFPAKMKFIFFKGGDRSDISTLPKEEVEVCRKYNCDIAFGTGGIEKLNSSTNINRLNDKEV